MTDLRNTRDLESVILVIAELTKTKQASRLLSCLKFNSVIVWFTVQEEINPPSVKLIKAITPFS